MTIPEIVRLLREADGLLSGPGLRVSEFAREHGTSHKTIFRRLADLRELAGPIECGDDWLHRYTDPECRLFREETDV